MDILDGENLLSEKDLFTTIWTDPKLALGVILKHYPKKHVTKLLVLGGIANTINRNAQQFSQHGIVYMLIIIALGGLFGWIFSYIYAMMLSWTGGWLKGKADSDQFLTVLAWSMIPNICFLFPAILRMIIFGAKTNISFDGQDMPTTVLFLSILGVEIILGIWAMFILIKGISLIQNFNIGKAILNACLPIAVIVVPILMIIWIIYVFS
jgi:hypothetical protein